MFVYTPVFLFYDGYVYIVSVWFSVLAFLFFFIYKVTLSVQIGTNQNNQTDVQTANQTARQTTQDWLKKVKYLRKKRKKKCNFWFTEYFCYPLKTAPAVATKVEL